VNYRLVIDMPGATKSALDVETGPVPGTLVVRAEIPEEEKPSATLRSERSQRFGGLTRYERVVPVAWDADLDKVKPDLKDGILTITVPKRTSGSQKSTKS
jgi:HSP20 family protein